MPHHPPRHPIHGGPVSQAHSRWPMMIIGVGKLIKSAVLIFVFYLTSYLMKPEQHQALEQTLIAWKVAPVQHHLYWALEKILAIDEKHLKLLHVGVMIYAVLFIIEGIGLILDFAWAEWLLVLTTGLLLPVELWEMIRGHNWKPAVIFVLNLAILIYVCYRLKWRMQDKRSKPGDQGGSPASTEKPTENTAAKPTTPTSPNLTA